MAYYWAKQIAYYVALLTYRSKCQAWTQIYHVSKLDMKPSILDRAPNENIVQSHLNIALLNVF